MYDVFTNDSYHSVCFPTVLVQGHSDSTFANFSLETAKPIKAFHVEPLWDVGTKVCSNGPGHMTNMAAIKNLLYNQKEVTLKVGM